MSFWKICRAVGAENILRREQVMSLRQNVKMFSIWEHWAIWDKLTHLDRQCTQHRAPFCMRHLFLKAVPFAVKKVILSLMERPLPPPLNNGNAFKIETYLRLPLSDKISVEQNIACVFKQLNCTIKLGKTNRISNKLHIGILRLIYRIIPSRKIYPLNALSAL